MSPPRFLGDPVVYMSCSLTPVGSYVTVQFTFNLL